MYVDPSKYKRAQLTDSQKEFFFKLVPLAVFLQRQTYNKAIVTQKPTHFGLCASLLCAHMLHKTEFGDHALAQQKYEKASANNLALLLSHKYWRKMTVTFEGTVYRAYTNWREFAVDFSDHLAWHVGFDEVLKQDTLLPQIKAMAEYEKNVAYVDTIVRIIGDYGLREFDWYGT